MSFLDFLFPKRSLEGKEGEWMTPSELPRLLSRPRLFSETELRIMGMPSLDRVLAVSAYHEVPLLRRAIHTFKYRRIPGLGEKLQQLLTEGFMKHIAPRRDACVCPVPLHWSREYWRGFNQAEILARSLAERTGLPLCALLRRIRPTGHQARRRRDARWSAVRGAFALNPNPNPLPFTIYLVDDLMTTGATMEECAKMLKAAGMKRVEGVVLAHG